MKQIYLFLLFIATSVALHAQTSGLYVYDGGYFIKNGDSWEEYRPKDKAERWASYNQYAQETNYFNVNNSQCTVSVPKATNNKFYIYRDNKWEPIYTTIAIYDWFPATETGRDVYAYDGGYFVRDGNKWREYRPKDKHALWAEYTQYSEEDNYYHIQNSSCSVSVPKSKANKFYIYRDNKWDPIYTTLAVLDSGKRTSFGSSSYSSSSATSYDYTLNFNEYYNNNYVKGGNTPYYPKSASTLRISRSGKAELTFKGMKYNFSFTEAAIKWEESPLGLLGIFFGYDDYEDEEEVIYLYFSSDKKHYIKLLDNGSECYIFSGNSSLNSGKRLDLSEGEESNKTIFEEIKKLIDNKSFFR